MLSRLLSYLSWRGFLIGFVAAVAAASAAGWILTQKDTFQNFQRFYLTISPETSYLPTARQYAAIVNARYQPGKTMVIIGGSSVMRGAGQRPTHVWTMALQKELGPRYVVVNLAMNGGGAPGAASYMAEMLLKTGRPAIYVSDMLPGTWHPASINTYYQYLYFDADARGYLLPWKPRSDYIGSVWNDQFTSLRIRALANRTLNFQDLWHHLGYCCVFTTYTAMLAPGPWKGRLEWPDNENPPATFDFRTQPAENNAVEVKIVTGYANAVVDVAAEKRGLHIAFPDTLRNHIIILSTGQAPFYKQQLAPADREKLDQYYVTWAQTLNSAGVTTAFADRVLEDADHFDRVHLTERGGESVARFVAPYVRRKAEELGYAK